MNEMPYNINGFVNYLAKFLPKLADCMEPLRRLTRKDTPWQWTQEQEDAFNKGKNVGYRSPSTNIL